MTNEELVKQIKVGKNTTHNMEALYCQNERYIHKIARKYQGLAELDDLMQEGYFGLYEAVQHYDSDREVSFMSYAYFWIKQAMKRYINKYCNPIFLPEHILNKIHQYKKLLSAYQMHYGVLPGDGEVCYYLGLSSKQLDNIKAAMQNISVKSLDAPMSEDEELCLGDTVSADEDMEMNVLDKVQTEQLKDTLWSMVDDLTGSYPSVIRSRYQDGLTLKDVGSRLGITASSVRDHERKALKELRRSRNRLSPYLCDYIDTHAYKGNGYKTFSRTWTSSTEYAALGLMES